MSNLDNVTKLKHINSLAAQTASAINELLINGLSGVGTADVFTGATSLAGGASGLVPAPAAGDEEKFLRGDGTWALPAGGASSDAIAGSTVLSTTPATVNGGMWYEIERDYPIIKIKHNGAAYNLSKNLLHPEYDYCVSWLKFDDASNPLYDVFSKAWQAGSYTPPMVDMSPFGTGKSVSITTDNYLYLDSLFLGGGDFTIDGWFYIKNGGGAYQRTFEIWREGDSSFGRVEQNFAYSDTNTIKYNQWSHFAMVYTNSAGGIAKFIDGKQIAYYKNVSVLQLRGPLQKTFIGESRYHNSDGRIDAYVSNFRIFDGIALWSANFTPPTAADYVLTA